MSSISTRAFALAVVHHEGRYVLVQEARGGQWYLPAGGVEPAETFAEAARRETREEAGLDVELEGVLRVEHTPAPDPARASARMRVVFLARPLDPKAPLKATPDEHSLKAQWFTFDEARGLPLRALEVVEVLRHVERGGRAHPLSLLTTEGAGYRD